MTSRSEPSALRYLAPFCLLVLASCKWDVGQFALRPPIEKRMKDNLSGQLSPPPAPQVGPDSFRFAVFGDPQIGQDLKSYLGHFRQDVARLGIDFFCVLGDMTEDCTEQERATLRAKLDSVGRPYFCTIGNHDLYQAEGWAWFKSSFGPSCYSVVVADRLKLIFLDSADGLLGATQFSWLEQELEASAGLVKIVGTHFPLYDGTQPIMWRFAGTGERYRLTSLLLRHGVHSYLAGHTHGWRYSEINGLRHFISALAPAETDYGLPGFVLFTWAHDSLGWERIEYDSPPKP